MLPQEQTKQIKKQLLEQLDSTNLPNKEEIKKSVQEMNSEQLEEFLIKNNLIKEGESPQQCIFCSIVSGQIPSNLVGENEKAIAVLEINPISHGHIIIIPKEHVGSEKELPEQAIELAKKISEKLKILKPKSIEVIPSNMFGHEILNVLPVYKDETLDSKRKKADETELQELQKIFKEKPKPIEKPQIKKIVSENLWLPKRIP